MPRDLTKQEYDAITARVLANAPPDLDEANYNRWIGPAMEAALGEAENLPSETTGSATRRLLTNYAEMVNPVEAIKGVGKAAYDVITGQPISGDTAKAVIGQMGEQWKQAGERFKEGDYIPAAGHALAGSIPLVGPGAAEAGEQIRQGDIAGGLGKAAGLLTPFGLPTALRLARSGVPAAAREAIAVRLEAPAASRIVDVMNPKIGANKARFGNIAEKIAPELLDEAKGFTREGMAGRISGRLAEAESKLDAANDARNAAKPVETKAMIDSLLEKRRQLTSEAVEGSLPKPSPATATMTKEYPGSPGGAHAVEVPAKAIPIGKDVVPSPNAARVAVIDKAISELQTLGPVSHYEPIRVMRQAYDGPAKAIYSPAMTTDYLTAQGSKMGAADVTGTLRDALAESDPATHAVNMEYHLYRSANDVLEATAEVERSRPNVARTIAARGIGAVIGAGTGGTVGATAGFLAGPFLESLTHMGYTTKLQTAALLRDLAGAIRGGNVKAVDTLSTRLRSLTRQGYPAAVALGRTPAQPEEQ